MENRKAFFEYEFTEKLIAGLVLTGEEVKGLRANNGNISTGYCVFISGELFLMNASVGSLQSRPIKLLLNKNELRKVSQFIETNQHTVIIPLRFLVNNLIKLEIGVGKGKKQYDKRQTIKKRDVERQSKRES